MLIRLNFLHVKHFWSPQRLLTAGPALIAFVGIALAGAPQAFANCETLLNGTTHNPKLTIDSYLREHRGGVSPSPSSSLSTSHFEKLKFAGVDGRDVYNPSAEFTATFEGRQISVLMGRVEPRENHESEVWFFTKNSEGTFVPLEGTTKYKMEDPFFSYIDGELVIGGVETYPDPLQPGFLAYRTVFFRDHKKGIEHLERFTTGPDRMKDIRMAYLKDSKEIIVATRPQSERLDEGGRGRVGLVYLKSLDELTPTRIQQARILHGQVAPDEWIGVNAIYDLGGGDVGFLAHVARYDEAQKVDVNGKTVSPRDYYGATFKLSNLRPRIYVERRDIDGTSGCAKRNDLANVVFNGGLRLNGDGTATGWFGVGDCEAYTGTFPSPF